MLNSRPHLFGMLAGLFLAAGLVLSAIVGTAAWVKIKNTQFVTVKGSARRNVTSDLVIWRGYFSVETETLIESQRRLQADAARVDSFLRGRGVTNFNFTPIGIDEVKATFKNADGSTQSRTAGYRLSQGVRIESGDISRVVRLDGETTSLVEQGVVFTTHAPEFIYTRAGEAKVEMLAEAARDARTRAEQIATQGGRAIAQLNDADMGVFQITPLHGVQTSWEGMNDTASLEKTITAVVTASFALR